MSLSATPPIEITSRTAPDIADELLGGTVEFIKETGYQSNAMMVTFFWSAFLFCIRRELIVLGLLNDVQNRYIYSFDEMFPEITANNETREQIVEYSRHYFNNLSNDFSDIKTEEEVLRFLQIAEKLNCYDNETASYLLKPNVKDQFVIFSSRLNSNVFKILRQCDNGMTKTYRGLVHSRHYAEVLAATHPENLKTRSSFASNTTDPSVSRRQSLRKIFFILLAVILGITLIGIIASMADSDLEPMSEPRSGEILTGSEYFYESEITVSASSGESCVVKLKTRTGVTRLSFYVRAGDTVTVGVPSEYLYVYFASGDTWYGEKHMFGEYTSYSMDSKICDFTKYTWEYTLYPVSDGNFSQTVIDEDEF